MESPLTGMGNTMEQQDLARKNRSSVWNMLSLRSLLDTQWRHLEGNKEYESVVQGRGLARDIQHIADKYQLIFP